MSRWLIYTIALLWTGVLGAESFMGATLAELEQRLGEAGGKIEMGESTIIVYERGFLTLRGGVVVSEDMMSAREYASYLKKRESSKSRWQEILNRRHALMRERALELKREKLNDPDFLALPLRDQIAFWGSFKAANPEISIEPHYTQLIQRYKAFMDDQRTQQIQMTYAEKLAEVQERLAEAEARAARAEQAAARARNTHNYSYPSYPPIWLYPAAERKPILQIQYQNDNFGVEYQSGGGTVKLPVVEVLK